MHGCDPIRSTNLHDSRKMLIVILLFLGANEIVEPAWFAYDSGNTMNTVSNLFRQSLSQTLSSDNWMDASIKRLEQILGKAMKVEKICVLTCLQML